MANDAVATTLFLGALLALIYPLGMWVLDRVAQPFRLQLADAVRRLRDSGVLGPEDRRFVQGLADRAFSPTAMPMAALLLPGVMVQALRKLANGGRIKSRADYDDRATRSDMVLLVKTFMISTAAANPIVAVLVLLEIGVFWLGLRLWGGAASLQDQFYNAFCETEHRVVRS